MIRLFKKDYYESLEKHYETYFGVKGQNRKWNITPQEKINSDFYVLEIRPNKIHDFWAYATLGMSFGKESSFRIELIIYSPTKNDSLIELLTMAASFHQTTQKLDLNHTINIGRPWLPDSICDHGLISLPYLDGEAFEIFKYNNEITHCYWLIPITKTEREYKAEKGIKALEYLFEQKSFNYLNPKRSCLIS